MVKHRGLILFSGFVIAVILFVLALKDMNSTFFIIAFAIAMALWGFYEATLTPEEKAKRRKNEAKKEKLKQLEKEGEAVGKGAERGRNKARREERDRRDMEKRGAEMRKYMYGKGR